MADGDYLYRLTIVQKMPQSSSGLPLNPYREDVAIGVFKDEESLIRWAEENRGEMARNNEAVE